MQSDPKFYPRKAAPPISYEVGGCTYNVPAAPLLNATVMGAKHSGSPVHGMNPKSPNCPKNFIIFDQTDNKCRIMFYPPPANKFNCPNFDIHTSYAQENDRNKNEDKSSSLKEDSEDIDALLSLEDEEDDDDEEVSTGRTMGNYVNRSPDSGSTDGSKICKTKLSSIQKSFSCSSSSRNSGNSERKRQKIKKMMKTLRGILPSGDQMDTATVLDEAVRYLKSLKVEVKKLGIKNFKKN
ncbi:transcription factor bHLH144-like [Tasmannia lanceolata]|uniref:transcription factor bHLH144-like n=1 Tax=Tasmannia lanceolata TaxID=3420 RepID=UPI004063D1EB